MAERSKKSVPSRVNARLDTEDLKHLDDLLARADGGDPKAQLDLALCYDSGDGIERDKEKAVYWFEKAAEQGSIEAQYLIGLMLYQGEAVPQNRSRAVYWMKKAADKGDAKAKWALAQMI